MKTRRYSYNMLLQSNDDYVKGELLTDKELEKAMHTRAWRRRPLKSLKVSVPSTTVYYNFGVRFTTEDSLKDLGM